MWAIMPVMGAMELTKAAIADVLAQTVPMKLLIINQGGTDDQRTELEQLAEWDERVFVWSFEPTLPSLSATWNRALRFVWETGEEEAFVVNNDVRLHPKTVEYLSGMMGHTGAYFVSAVGVTKEQFEAYDGADGGWLTPPDQAGWGHPNAPGGPDFSCFLL